MYFIARETGKHGAISNNVREWQKQEFLGSKACIHLALMFDDDTGIQLPIADGKFVDPIDSARGITSQYRGVVLTSGDRT